VIFTFVPRRAVVLAGTSTAVFVIISALTADPSLAGRALRVKPAPAQIGLNQLEACITFGEESPQCLEALANLAPAAGPRGFEVHEEDPGHGGNGSSGGSSGGGSGGGTSSSGGSSGGGSSSGSTSGGGSSSGSTSGSTSGGSSGGSSNGTSGEDNGKNPNSGSGNGSEPDENGDDQDPGNSGDTNQGGD
jgi:hypothetical protein